MNLNMFYAYCFFFFFNKFSEIRMSTTFHHLATPLLTRMMADIINDAPVYSTKSLAAFMRTVLRVLARPVLHDSESYFRFVQQAH
jgi:hypothetical protein